MADERCPACGSELLPFIELQVSRAFMALDKALQAARAGKMTVIEGAIGSSIASLPLIECQRDSCDEAPAIGSGYCKRHSEEALSPQMRALVASPPVEH